MKKKLLFISVIFVALIVLWNCSVYATNILLITEEGTVDGNAVSTMLEQIGNTEFTVTEIAIYSGSSFYQEVRRFNPRNSYDCVIIQLPYDSIISGTTAVSESVSAISILHEKLGSPVNTKYYIGSSVGSIANYESESLVSSEVVQAITNNQTIPNVRNIPVYENLQLATSRSLEVFANNKLTSLGNLLVACTYSNSLGKSTENLTSYKNGNIILADADVKEIVKIASGDAGVMHNTSEPETLPDTSDSNASTPKSSTSLARSSTSSTSSTSKTSRNTSDSAQNSSTAKKTTTAKEVDETGDLEPDDSTLGFAAFKSDREPRLVFAKQDDYLYIEIKDMAGVACEYPSGNYKAEKKLQPQIYYYNNDKRGNVVPNLKRPSEADYNKKGKEYVYTIGLPANEIGKEYTKFQIVACDVSLHNYIREVFMVRKNGSGELVLNRAPSSCAVTLRTDMKKLGMHVSDASGISKCELRTLPKSDGKPFDTIREWNGAVQNDWSSITYVTLDDKYVTSGLTKFENINTIFNKSNWVGQNPMVSGEDGVYQVMVMAADASGASSVKTMTIDTRYYIIGDSFEETGNSKPKESSRKSTKKATASTKKSSNEEPIIIVTGDLKKGSKGEEVKNLQKRLNQLGWNLKVDGDFGSKTKAAVKEFQALNSLKVDGIVGPETRGALNSENAIGKPSNNSNIVTGDLKKGSKGDEVKKLQKRLNQLGWDLKVDGKFGNKTKAAVKKFQELNSIKVDGVVGSQTRAALNNEDAIALNSNKKSSKKSSKKSGESSGESSSEAKRSSTSKEEKEVETETAIINTYYVSKNGSDSNDGKSAESALKTIKKGIDKLGAGDKLIIGAGNYKEKISIDKKGTASKKIYIEANGEVALDGDGGSGTLLTFSKNTAYVNIKGITFKDLNAKDARGICLKKGTNNITIADCKFSNIKCPNPSKESNTANAIYFEGSGKSESESISDIIVKDCTLTKIVAGWSEAISIDCNCRNITIDGVTFRADGVKSNIAICVCGSDKETNSNNSVNRPKNVTIKNCDVSGCVSPYGDTSYGIYVDGASDVKIIDNIVSDCEGGIEVGSEKKNSNYKNHETESITVENNTIKRCPWGMYIGGFDSSCGYAKNITINGNNIVDCGQKDKKEMITFDRCNKVTFKNNTISSTNKARIIYLSKKADNLTFESNTYSNGNKESDSDNFGKGDSDYSFSSWKKKYKEDSSVFK